MKETNLKLSEKQESDLVDYLMDRMEQLKTDNKERIDSDKLSWNTYQNDRTDRFQHDTIWANSNVSLPLTSLVVDHFLARAEDEITGSSPYFKFNPQGPTDLPMAESFDKYFNWKLETRGRVRERLEESYLHIFLQRAAVMKSVYEEKKSIWFDHERNALFNRETGEFEELLDYGPIIEGDANFSPSVDPGSGNVELRLNEDPSFALRPEIHEFRPYPEGIPTEQIKYKGPRTVVVDSDRFLCPTNVENIEDAEALMELYDKPMRWVKDMFLEREWMDFSTFSNMVKKDANPQSETDKNKEYKEDLSFDNDKFPMVQIVECWVSRDVLGTGIPQDFVVFLEPQCKKAIYYEYVAKVTPDNKIPYTTVSIGKHKNKWWGPSLPEKIYTYQQYIDKQFNSQSYRNELAANPIVGVNPQAVEDEPDEVELSPGKVFQLKDQHQIDDFISAVQLPNHDMNTQNMIDFVFGLVQLWLGVSNMAQGDYQALAPANTATGVEATLREASKIGRRWMRRIVRGFEEHLTKLVKVSMATLDQPEVYQYMEGDVQQFATMSPEMVESLDMDVTVILSRDQGQRAIEKAQLALQVQQQYFEAPPEIRPFTRPMLKRMLDAMGYENTDELLPQEAPSDPRQEAEIMKLLSDGAGAPPAAGANTQGATQAMGNSNQAGANQYQRQAG
tara:strand:+ start:62 stop:2083 length:2022 start_codon:yes stop_codon:yes gene_type:complete